MLLVVVGGGIGAGIRHLTSMGALRLVAPNYPWGTMAINIIGSFAMGLLWERGATLPAFGYALASVIVAIVALFLGLWFVRSLP
ncbi:hypothetical protein LB543_14050 [Mesorhizobium sp. ESP7-2]|uniref:CrcB family protein n=1 Tax=Mesorhizobium sp. ESP7-2 TaxID=2876622 RepID=UPI001CCDD47B|nr:CrcB family protein [Mesorhizobium sp. ESP7-2]MBZ9707846.1 hypothetical protein [Mesorhizobium sp. ESP7-2]